MLYDCGLTGLSIRWKKVPFWPDTPTYIGPVAVTGNEIAPDIVFEPVVAPMVAEAAGADAELSTPPRTEVTMK